MYNDATTGGANETLRDIAFRSYAWASYCTQASGVSLVGPSEKDVWFRIQAGRKSKRIPLATKNLLEDTDGLCRSPSRRWTQSISDLSMR